MSLLTKIPVFLGIDFGLSHIKVVELTLKNNRPFLLNYGEILTEDIVVKGKKNEPETVLSVDQKMPILLEHLLQKMSPKTDTACVAMPGFSGLISLIELPQMEKAELESAVHFEAQRYIPYPLSEVILSWEVISTPAIHLSHTSDDKDNEEELMSVLMVAALHKEVEKYEHYISNSSLKMETLELETFSLARSLISETEKTGAYLIVDIGLQSTNIILVEDSFVKVNRNVNAGGAGITTTLAEALSIASDRAEILKTGDKDLLNTKESAVIFPSLELILNETKRIINAYKEKNSGSKNIHAVILSGGASKMKGLDTYCSQILGLPTRIGNPWLKVSYDEMLQKSVTAIGPSYSVAIGLALAGIESFEKESYGS
jgi:type IV pilus assembly protein PilM